MNDDSKTSFPYEDLLHLPHPTSLHHPRMSLQDRAAQFTPFAALTGYEDAVEQTALRKEQEMAQEIQREFPPGS